MESEIIRLWKLGWTYREIAAEVGCSQGAVNRALRIAGLASRQVRLTVDDEHGILRLLREGLTHADVIKRTGWSQRTISRVINDNGGVLPKTTTCSPLRLSLAEREEISRLLVVKESFAEIARRLGRVTSTISREVNNNGGPEHYRAGLAHTRAHEKAKRPKQAKLVQCPALQAEVQQRLEAGHSPQQIANRLVDDFPDDPAMRISPEAIYQSLFIQGRGALRRELTACLRTGRAVRRPQQREKKQVIKDMVMISDRPAEAEDRAVPGHWEGDLIIGKDNKSAIGTLVERSSRLVMLMKLSNKQAATLKDALVNAVQRLPAELVKSLTWDQGTEMANHVDFTVDTGVQVYFCDPHSPWQRGSNENTNGLLRQYFPKGTALSGHSQEHLDDVARKLNGRPRETLGWQTPAERFAEFVAMTG